VATNFPTSLDSLTNPASGDSLSSPSHAGQHADANDAIEALEAKVGVNGSAVTTSLDYKVTNGILSGLNVDSGVLYVDATNNRVGVNKTNPAHAVDVVGRVETRAAATQDGVAIVGRAGGTSSFDVVLTPTTLSADRTLTLPDATGTAVTTGNLSDITSTGTLSSLTVTGNVTVDTNTLFVNSSTNRVGVVNASPSYALDVVGDINASVALRIAGNAIGSGINYTPSWTSTGTAPAIGNGTLSGRYFRVGNLIIAQIYWLAGSTTTFGTAAYRMSLPVTSAALTYMYGFAQFTDASTFNTYIMYAQPITTTTSQFTWNVGGINSVWAQTTPVTMANGDAMQATLIYEAA